MPPTLRQEDTPSVQTRPSMVAGLQSGDEDRWREFLRKYSPVIRGFAKKAGLTEVEADEVVQETAIGVSRNVEEYRYDPSKCRFKTWLLNLASWRIRNQLRRRRRWDDRKVETDAPAPWVPANEDRAVAEVPDTWTSLWDAEWRDRMMALALEGVRAQFSPTHLQIFDLNVLKQWSAGEVAKALGVSLPTVYLAKHRISVALKKEIARLERLDAP
ncbi:MAG: sigma-70 family RNA polymerase sigma factor [Verrucomicrobiales bacterium]|nr:sigma-70 family RNA polymerase sigma factor [Verrucomicrobiales bacterium]